MFNLPSVTAMKTLTHLALAALLALPLVAAAQQHVYRCPGPDGRMIYTDKHCSTGNKLRMSHKAIGSRVTVEAADPKAASKTAPAAPASAAPAAAASAAASAAAPAASAASAAEPAASEASAAPVPAAPTKPTAQGVQL